MAADIPGTFTAGFVPPPLIHDQEGTRIVRGVLTRKTGFPSKCDVWQMGECSVVVAHEPQGKNGEMMWHLSISCVDRHPTWDEIKTARYKLLPRDLCFAILLPPPQYWINLKSQDHVFHLHEIYDEREPWTGG